MGFKNFPTCHCHSVASLDTAATPEAFAAKEAELESGALTVTDHGTMAGCRKIYDLAKGKKYKGKLTPILGLEAYFRDDACPILNEHGLKYVKKTDTDYLKYHHFCMHYLDEAAYSTASRLLSAADARAEQHGSERKPLFAWQQVEELGAQNITMTSGCLIGMVQKHLAFGGRADIAEAYYVKMRSLVKPGNFYVEVFPHVCDRNWDSAVVIKFEDGTEERFKSWKNLKTDKKYQDKSDGVHADKLAALWEKNKEDHGSLRAVMMDRKWVEREPKKIVGVQLIENFIMNECAPWAPGGDLQLGANRFMIHLATKYGDKILISDDSHFATPDEKIVQDIKLQAGGGAWKFATSYHRQSSQDAWEYFKNVLGVPQPIFESWIDNSIEWSQRFKDFKFTNRKSLPTSFYPENTLAHTFQLIQKVGRFDIHNPDQAKLERLRSEIRLLHENGTIDLLPYFFIDEEVVDLYEQHGELTGPGRGSAAGMLTAYLLGITHVNPLKYGLSQDRFMTVDRVQSGKLPDIDQDLPHRDLLVSPDPATPEKGWLHRRFGPNVAQISVDTTLKLRSAVKDVARVMSPTKKVPGDVEGFAKKFENAPQGVSDRDFVFGYKGNDGWVQGSIERDEALKEYIKRYPAEWEVVQKCLGIPRQKSRHACAYVIADEPIANFIPLTSVSDITVTQYTAPSVEAMGGLKMDFLVVNSLKDIASAIKLIQGRKGYLPKDERINGIRVPGLRAIPFKDELVDVWDLPEDQAVFRRICEGDTEGVFQFNTPGARQWLRNFNHVKSTDPDGTVHKAIDSIGGLSDFTALDRPGPLDAYVTDIGGKSHNMLVEYARRARGEPGIGGFPVLDKLFPESYGIIVYQEQVQKAFHEIGETTAIQANDFRIHVSKKQKMEIMADKAVFMPKAVEKLGEKAAEQLWQSMETFGSYAFNKSHSVCYVVIGYACAWLKYHYPLEWWTAVLRNATRNEIDEKFWRHCGHLIDMPDTSFSGTTFEIQNERIRAPLSLLHGIGEKAHAQLVQLRPYSSIQELCHKIEAFKQQGTTTVMRAVKKDGEKTGEMKPGTLKGRCALNKGVIQTLVVGGTLDSLFPPGTPILDQLLLYFAAKAAAEGKKRQEPIDPKYINLTPLTRYQLIKGILPAYSQPLFGLLTDPVQPGITRDEGGSWYFRHRKLNQRDPESYLVMTASGLEWVDHLEPLPPGGWTVAVPAFVVTDERRTYHETKKMAKLTLDIDGVQRTFIKWGDRDGKLPSNFRASFAGCIAMVILTKFAENRDMSVDDVVVIQDVLKQPEEQSPETEGAEP